MKPIGRAKTRKARRFRRHIRMRKRIRGTTERPRLVVFRSLKHMYAQIVDDTTGRTLVHASDTSRDFSADRSGKIGASFAVGQAIARKAQDKGINKVVFDRAGYPYHGRVKAVAEGAREAGMEF